MAQTDQAAVVSGSNKHARVLRSFSTKTDDDLKSPWLRDICIIPGKNDPVIVVVDLYNHCVKSYYKKNSVTCHSRLALDDKPWSVTKLTNDKVAVSIPYKCQISIISASPELKPSHVIKTSNACYGLSAIKGNVLAMSALGNVPITLEALDLKGRVIASFSFDTIGHPLFSNPAYLGVTPDSAILVSDSCNKAVIGLTLSGEIKFKYCPGEELLKFPFGIACDKASNIFIADPELNKVIQLTKTGHFVRDVLTTEDKLDMPCCVTVDDKNCLYVTNFNGDITVYGLK